MSRTDATSREHRVPRLLALCWSALACAAAADPLTAAPGRYLVDAGASRLHVLVYRGGLLGAFGHNHVVSAARITGSVTLAEAFADSGVELELRANELVVDDPELRRLQGDGFEQTIAAEDVAATRANMLGPRLLDAERHPVIHLRSLSIEGEPPQLRVLADVSVAGVSRELEFPVTIEWQGDTLLARGERRLRHRELGLEPFTAVIGTLRVRDEMTVSYRIAATRGEPSAGGR